MPGYIFLVKCLKIFLKIQPQNTRDQYISALIVGTSADHKMLKNDWTQTQGPDENRQSCLSGSPCYGIFVIYLRDNFTVTKYTCIYYTYNEI